VPNQSAPTATPAPPEAGVGHGGGVVLGGGPRELAMASKEAEAPGLGSGCGVRGSPDTLEGAGVKGTTDHTEESQEVGRWGEGGASCDLKKHGVWGRVYIGVVSSRMTTSVLLLQQDGRGALFTYISVDMSCGG
jgi:hypothetical protein